MKKIYVLMRVIPDLKGNYISYEVSSWTLK